MNAKIEKYIYKKRMCFDIFYRIALIRNSLFDKNMIMYLGKYSFFLQYNIFSLNVYHRECENKIIYMFYKWTLQPTKGLYKSFSILSDHRNIFVRVSSLFLMILFYPVWRNTDIDFSVCILSLL